MNLRHEYKHSLNFMDYRILRSRLCAVLPRDSNAGESGEYTVRSLYFDTPGDRALREKIDGVDRREKFRVRRYNDHSDFLRLEKKSKANGLCCKQTVPISREELSALSRGDLGWMAGDGRPLVTELYSKMTGGCSGPKPLWSTFASPLSFPRGMCA